MGVAAILSIIYLSKIKFGTFVEDKIAQNKGFISIIRDSIKNLWLIILGNKPFRHYQIAFMGYGFAFMITVTVISIFLTKAMNLSFTDIAFYKNYYNTIAIVLLPVFGKLLGKTDPRKFGIFTFASLLLHFVFLIAADYFKATNIIFGIKINWFLIISFTFMGLFAATMGLLWYIGSAYFCTSNDTAHYQSIHLTLTGFRASVAPLIGVGLYEIIGFKPVFFLGIVFLSIGMAVFYFSTKTNP